MRAGQAEHARRSPCAFGATTSEDLTSKPPPVSKVFMPTAPSALAAMPAANGGMTTSMLNGRWSWIARAQAMVRARSPV